MAKLVRNLPFHAEIQPGTRRFLAVRLPGFARNRRQKSIHRMVNHSHQRNSIGPNQSFTSKSRRHAASAIDQPFLKRRTNNQSAFPLIQSRVRVLSCACTRIHTGVSCVYTCAFGAQFLRRSRWYWTGRRGTSRGWRSRTTRGVTWTWFARYEVAGRPRNWRGTSRTPW